MTQHALTHSHKGSTLVEVLVTFMVLAIGLLGMAGLLVKLQSSEMESYQRTQALMLLNDMSNRISINRNNIAEYVVAAGAANPTGTGVDCAGLPIVTQANKDIREWCFALQGAGESNAGNSVGAMIGGRGCIEQPAGAGSPEFMITVVWQGLAPLVAPPATVACGVGLYDSATCVGDLCRRAVTTVVQVANL